MKIATLLAAMALAGCTAGPDYEAPQTDAQRQWTTPAMQRLFVQQQDSQIQRDWWRSLQDPVLSDLISQAVTGNLDVEIAHSRLRQARARRGITTADLHPNLNAKASISKQETNYSSNQLYSAGFDASWELDFFGGKRRAVEAAQAEMDATEADLRDLMVILLADVAINYVNVRVYQSRLTTVEASLANQLEALDLARWRVQSGLATELDIEQALYAAEQTRAQLPVLRNGLQQNLNRLAVLLGLTPGTLDARLTSNASIPTVPITLTVGMPIDALRQRPDVRRAERRLAAQTAQVGVAKAAQYPSFTLSGFIGSESQSSEDLYKSSSTLSSLAGGLTMPLFNAGKLRRNVEIQEELRQQALLAYHTTVLDALEEAENALTSYVNEYQHGQTLKTAVESAWRASELAKQQYESGLVDFQTVLVNQRSHLLLLDDLNQSNGEVVANVIRIYKAMGGGWTDITHLGAINEDK